MEPTGQVDNCSRTRTNRQRMAYTTVRAKARPTHPDERQHREIPPHLHNSDAVRHRTPRLCGGRFDGVLGSLRQMHQARRGCMISNTYHTTAGQQAEDVHNAFIPSCVSEGCRATTLVPFQRTGPNGAGLPRCIKTKIAARIPYQPSTHEVAGGN